MLVVQGGRTPWIVPCDIHRHSYESMALIGISNSRFVLPGILTHAKAEMLKLYASQWALHLMMAVGLMPVYQYE